MNVLTRAELSENVAFDRAAQILATGKADAVSDLLKEIMSVTVADVTKVGDFCDFCVHIASLHLLACLQDLRASSVGPCKLSVQSHRRIMYQVES